MNKKRVYLTAQQLEDFNNMKDVTIEGQALETYRKDEQGRAYHDVTSVIEPPAELLAWAKKHNATIPGYHAPTSRGIAYALSESHLENRDIYENDVVFKMLQEYETWFYGAPLYK